MFESILVKRDGVNSFGEVKYFPDRGCLKNELCSCGVSACDCSFWAPVISKMAYWDHSEMASITRQFESTKYFLWNLILIKLGVYRNKLKLYQKYNYELYSILEEHGKFVDSSKMPARVYFLAAGAGVRSFPFERIYWVVRDPRGVAWSCGKSVARPEATASEDRMMPKFGYFSSLGKWFLNVLVSGFVYIKYREYVELVKYEDLSAMTVGQSGPLDSVVSLHSISGNPRRFTGGLKEIKIDVEWKSGLTTWQKKTAYYLLYPLMKSFGYKSV
ncbi:hypothetical protein [Zhongshania arctica]|uniref:Sulfotransferase n=1 Tax=Zhongshania arctica TaxID=3238302 RepID=A0ABV3TS25_9GAMM